MSEYHLSCDQYKKSVFNKFSHLQHDEEFVDLTLAADGHLVKVHKNVIAVASPYLKEMLKSAASQSPVIFLNKVNHVILKHVIEYIYQGEVNVPVELLKEFVEVAKALHIHGIYNVDSNQLPKPERFKTVEPINTRPNNKIASGIAAHIKINNVNNSHSLEVKKCNDLETTNADSDFNVENEHINTTDYIDEIIEYPTGDGIIDTVTLPTFNNEISNEITEHRLLNDNIVKKSESTKIIIQDIKHTGKKLEIVIDATNATENVTGTNLNVTEYAENNCENINFDTQNITVDPNNIINDHQSAKDLLSNAHLETTEENDVMMYDYSLNTSIQIQPLSTTDAVKNIDSLDNIELDKIETDELRGMAQYTFTQRGSRQLILNRFMYCCQFESRRGLRTRWRCIDYRRSRCPAMIEMENNKILKRTGAHAHGFHDKKIYKKHSKGLIFNTMEIAKEAYNDNPTRFED